jgi:hypothetical protein
MAGHQGRVQIDHQARYHRAGAPHGGNRPAGLAAQQPGPFPRDRPGELHPIQERLPDRVEDPPGGRGGGHRPEQVLLVAQHREIADRDAAVGEHHRQISQHTARRVRRPTLPTTADRGVERLPDTNRGRDIGEQPRPDMRADTPPVGGDRDLRI